MRCFTFICRWSDVFNLYFSPWYFPFYFQMNLYVYFYMRMKWWFWFLCLTDHRSVETAGIPRAARVREFQTTLKCSCGRRPGNPTDAVPYAAIHRHRAWWLPGNNTHTVNSQSSSDHKYIQIWPKINNSVKEQIKYEFTFMIGEMKCVYLKCYFSVVVSIPAFTSQSLTDSQQHVRMGTGKESTKFWLAYMCML